MHIIYFPPGGWEGRPGRPHAGKRGPPFPGIYHWLAVAGGLLLLFGDIAAPKLPIHVTLSYPNKFRGWTNFFDLLLMLYLGWIGVSSQLLKKELTQQPHMSVAAHFPVCGSPIATSISVLCLLQKPIAEAAIHTPKNPLLSLSTCPSTFSLRENAFLLEQICAPCGGFPGLSTVSACPAPPRASSVSLSIHTCKHLLSPRQALFSHLPALALRPARMDLGYQVWKRHRKHPGPAAHEDDSCVSSDSTWEPLNPNPPLGSSGSSGLQHF